MDTITAPESFQIIRDKELEIDRLKHWKFNDATPDARVKAADDLKQARRELYRLFDELSHDEIVEYGRWVGVPTD